MGGEDIISTHFSILGQHYAIPRSRLFLYDRDVTYFHLISIIGNKKANR